MTEQEKKPGIGCGIVLITVFAVNWLLWFNNECSWSDPSCLFLAVLATFSILTGFLLGHEVIRYREISKSEQTSAGDANQTVPGSIIWFRAVLRVILSSILAAIPLIFRGAFISVVTGLIIGALVFVMIHDARKQ
ncbi:MAG: hypothetical protein KA314_24515 [Chloroflexi bacterium]|nr:hypothetical protein [Chloroflexota bacterium]MBP8059010.1 hypothetical protein [Chloroflexota bacterium]